MPGSSSPKGDPSGNVNIMPIKPAWMPGSMTIANQPGQLSSLAQDMTAGGFGSYEPDLAWLRNVFRPAQSVAYNGPEGGTKKPTTKTPTTKVTTGTPKKPTTGDPVQRLPVSPVSPVAREGSYGPVRQMMPTGQLDPKTGALIRMLMKVPGGRNAR